MFLASRFFEKYSESTIFKLFKQKQMCMRGEAREEGRRGKINREKNGFQI